MQSSDEEIELELEQMLNEVDNSLSLPPVPGST